MRRRLLALGLCLTMIYSLTACGETKKEAAETTVSEEKTEATAKDMKDPIDEIIEDASKKVAEDIKEALAPDTRYKKVDDVPEEMFNACVAKAEEKIEEIEGIGKDSYRLVRADVSGNTEHWSDTYLTDNELVLHFEVNCTDGITRFTAIDFQNINTDTIEEVTDIWLPRLHYHPSLEVYDEVAWPDWGEDYDYLHILFDTKLFN